MENQKQITRSSQAPLQTLQPVETLTNSQILSILMVAEYAMPSNFEVLRPDGWKWICEKIKKHHPQLTHEELAEIIEAGTMGEYNLTGNPPINSMTIFRWIKCFLNTKYEITGTNQSGANVILTENLQDFEKIKNNPNFKIISVKKVYDK